MEGDCIINLVLTRHFCAIIFKLVAEMTAVCIHADDLQQFCIGYFKRSGVDHCIFFNYFDCFFGIKYPFAKRKAPQKPIFCVLHQVALPILENECPKVPL